MAKSNWFKKKNGDSSPEEEEFTTRDVSSHVEEGFPCNRNIHDQDESSLSSMNADQEDRF